MALNIGKTKGMDEGVWVDYDEDVSFKLRFLSPDAVRKVKQPLEKTKRDHRTGQKTKDVDEIKLTMALLDYVIVDWKGIVIDGKTAKCTLENKRQLAGISTKAVTFIMDEIQEEANFEKNQQEKQEKN